MANTDLSLREIKKARTKLALYEAGMSLIGDKMFHEVMLEDICRLAEVSKVTFFKMYPKKEDLLIYFMRVWLTERIIVIDREGLRGFSAVRYLLQDVARQSADRPGIMPSLISFLSQMKMHPRMPELSEAEVRLLFPGQEELGRISPDLFVLFLRAMQEAEQEGTLRAEVTADDAVKVLFTIFYGAFLTAQQFASQDIAGYYELHLQLLERHQEG